MPETGFGGVDITTSFTDNYVYSDNIGMPSGRAMANGSRATLITHVRAFIAGRGGSRAFRMQLGSSETGTYTIGSAGSAVGTQYYPLNQPLLAQGGSTRFTLYFNGSTYFGRSNDGNGFDSYGTRFGSLGGTYQWAQAPSNPAFIDVGPNGNVAGSLHTDFRGATDDGGAGIYTYLLQWSKTSDFSSGVNEFLTKSGQIDVFNLDVGARYYFRSAAKNAVTDAAGTVGPWSNVVSEIAPGVPSAPRNLRATNATNAFGTVDLIWDAPTNTGGGITGYDIWNGNGLVRATNGTGTSVRISGRPVNADHTWFVRARNAYADRSGQRSANSNSVNMTTQGPPSAPRNLTAIASTTVAGRISLAWAEPATVGTGITKYTIYSSTGAVIQDNISSSTRTYNVDGLTPGTYYAYYVVAWNTIAQAVGTGSDKSNTAGATSLGDPSRPSGLRADSSPLVANRLVLSWSQSGPYTGFNIYETTSGSPVFLATVRGTSYVMDNVTEGRHTFVISARNTVTDSTNPVSEGPRTAPFSGTAGTSSSMAIGDSAVVNRTNEVFNGSAVIVGTTARSITYSRLNGPTVLATSVPANSGTVVDNTNQSISLGGTILALPTLNQFTFSQTGKPDLVATAVTNAVATNTTNAIFATTVASPATVTAVNATLGTVSYSKVASDISSRAATGTITNKSNTVYNTTGAVITAATANTISYAKTNANLAETGATGSVENITNSGTYNATSSGTGAVRVLSTPSYNTFTYARTSTNLAYTSSLAPFGSAYRSTSRAKLNVKYRSGWIG